MSWGVKLSWFFTQDTGENLALHGSGALVGEHFSELPASSFLNMRFRAPLSAQASSTKTGLCPLSRLKVGRLVGAIIWIPFAAVAALS